MEIIDFDLGLYDISINLGTQILLRKLRNCEDLKSTDFKIMEIILSYYLEKGGNNETKRNENNCNGCNNRKKH